MRQKSKNESMTSRGMNMDGMTSNVMDIDDLLDDEGWDLLNGLTEEELEQLNSDFDPENALIAVGDRQNHKTAINAAPMYTKEDLLVNLEKMVVKSKPVIKNETLRKKEEERKKQKELDLDKKYLKKKPNKIKEEMPKHIALTAEEEELLNGATEEELIEAAENALQQRQHDMREKILFILNQRYTDEKHLLSTFNNKLLSPNTTSRSIKTYGESSASFESTNENDDHFFKPMSYEQNIQDENNNNIPLLRNFDHLRHLDEGSSSDSSRIEKQRPKTKTRKYSKGNNVTVKNSCIERVRLYNEEKKVTTEIQTKQKTKRRKSSMTMKIEHIKFLNEKQRKYSVDTMSDYETENTIKELDSDLSDVSDSPDSFVVVAQNQSFNNTPNDNCTSPVKVNCNVSVNTVSNQSYNENSLNDEIIIAVDIDINLEEHLKTNSKSPQISSTFINSSQTDRTLTSSPIKIESDISADINQAITNKVDKNEERSDLDLKYNLQADDNVSKMIEDIKRKKELKRKEALDKKNKKKEEEANKQHQSVAEESIHHNKASSNTYSLNPKIKEIQERTSKTNKTKVEENKPINKLLNKDKFGFLEKSTSGSDNNSGGEINKKSPKKLPSKLNNPFAKYIKDDLSSSTKRNSDIESKTTNSESSDIKLNMSTDSILPNDDSTSLQSKSPRQNVSSNSLKRKTAKRETYKPIDDDDSGIDRSNSVFSMCTPTDLDSRIQDDSSTETDTKTISDTEQSSTYRESKSNGTSEDTSTDGRTASECDSKEVQNKASKRTHVKVKTYRRKSFDRTVVRRQKSVEKLNQMKELTTHEEETKTQESKRFQKSSDKIEKSKNKLKRNKSIENLDLVLKQNDIIKRNSIDLSKIENICDCDNLQIDNKKLNQKSETYVTKEETKNNQQNNHKVSSKSTYIKESPTAFVEDIITTKYIATTNQQPDEFVNENKILAVQNNKSTSAIRRLNQTQEQDLSANDKNVNPQVKINQRQRKKSDPFKILNRVKNFNKLQKSNNSDPTSSSNVNNENKIILEDVVISKAKDEGSQSLAEVIKQQKEKLKTKTKSRKNSVEDKLRYIKDLNSRNASTKEEIQLNKVEQNQNSVPEQHTHVKDQNFVNKEKDSKRHKLQQDYVYKPSDKYRKEGAANTKSDTKLEHIDEKRSTKVTETSRSSDKNIQQKQRKQRKNSVEEKLQHIRDVNQKNKSQQNKSNTDSKTLQIKEDTKNRMTKFTDDEIKGNSRTLDGNNNLVEGKMHHIKDSTDKNNKLLDKMANLKRDDNVGLKNNNGSSTRNPKDENTLKSMLNKDNNLSKQKDNNKRTENFFEKLKKVGKPKEEVRSKTEQLNTSKQNITDVTPAKNSAAIATDSVDGSLNFLARRKNERLRRQASESEENENPFLAGYISEEPKAVIQRNQIVEEESSSEEEEEEEEKPQVVTYDKDFFAQRRAARQKKQDDNYVEEEYKFEEKLSASQQIDLLNLQREKEREARKLMAEIEKIKQAVETKTPVDKVKRSENKSNYNKKENDKKIVEVKKNQTAGQPKKDVPKIVVNSPLPERKNRMPSSPLPDRKLRTPNKSPQVEKSNASDNSKEAGLQALENIRMKLRKVPKIERKEESSDEEGGVEIDVTEKRRKMIESVNGEAKPARKSALELLLEKDCGSLEEKKKAKESQKEEVIDCRGVTADLLKNALLKMNGILTNDQINSVWAGEKPKGNSITGRSNVKATPNKSKMIRKEDEETELDVVALMRCLKEDTDDLFYICINNQPKLEKHVLEEVFRTVERSQKVKHLSLAMCGIIDSDLKKLAKAIRYNEQLETLNLESNVIGMSGIDALMKVVQRHPTLREIKVSNQKQPFGGNGEECMAKAIHENENILKFGYSFMQAGPRNKADRAIIRHNENLRQRRRQGEENVYDLKATCKIRDPWPQPWIKVKGRRLLGGLIEHKASAMGRMIDVDSDVRRESRGPKLRDQEAAPLDINQLLSARKEKLKGSKIADLEEIQEQKRKKQFLEMQEEIRQAEEAERLKNAPPPPTPVAEPEAEKVVAKDIVQLEDDEARRRNKRPSFEDEDDLKSGDNDDSPPTEEKKIEKVTAKEPEKKNLRGTGLKIAGLEGDEKSTTRRRRKKVDEEEDDGLDFSAFQTQKEEEPEEVAEEQVEEVASAKEEEKKETPEERKKRLSREGGKKIVANLNTEDVVPRRRRKQRSFSEDDEIKDEAEETPVEEVIEEVPAVVEEQPKKKTSITEKAKPIASLSPNSQTIGRRRKKPDDEEVEEINPFANVSQSISKLASPDVIRRRRKNKYDEEEEEQLDLERIAQEQKKEEERLKKETEKKAKEEEAKEKLRKEEEERTRIADIEGRKKKLSLEGGKKVASLLPLDDPMPRRRRRKQYDDESEENEFLKVEPKKEDPVVKEEKVEAVPEPVKEPAKPSKEEEKRNKNEAEDRKKKLSREGGIKIASLAPMDEPVPRFRRRPRSPVAEDEPAISIEPEPKPEPVVEEKKEEVKEPAKKRIDGGKKIVAALPPANEVGIVRRKKKSREEEEKETFVNPIDLVAKSEKNAIVNAGKKIKGLEPVQTGVTPIRRRRKRDEEEEYDPFASVTQTKTEETKTEAEVKEVGQWFTDDETKLGDRRTEEASSKSSEFDLFAERNDGEPKKLSLRERMARSGR